MTQKHTPAQNIIETFEITLNWIEHIHAGKEDITDNDAPNDAMKTLSEIDIARQSISEFDINLIAAAPELLEALETTLEAIKRYPEHPMTASEVVIRKAIAKARGEA